ncbi:hypothetical protein MRX96_004214 [Rhipicephalus microplus]
MVTCVGEWLISSYHMELLTLVGCRVRSLLQGIIFRKATLLSPASAQPVGYVASLLGVDCLVLCNWVHTLPLPFCGILTLPLLFWMLSGKGGSSAHSLLRHLGGRRAPRLWGLPVRTKTIVGFGD